MDAFSTLAIVLLLVALFLILVVWLPHRLTRYAPKDKMAERLDLENKLRATFSQSLGGFAVLLGVWLTYGQFLQNRETTRLTYELSQRSLVSETFSRAITQLAATQNDRPALEIRLGGIYTLARMARESRHLRFDKDGAARAAKGPLANYDLQIVEILAAYVRTNAPVGRPNAAPPTLDIQTILSLLTDEAYLADPKRELRLDLRDVDLRGVKLRNAHLARTDLTEAWLDGADLKEALLEESVLIKARLREASFYLARLGKSNFTEADLTGADFSEAQLRGAYLIRAKLSRTQFRDADLRDAFLSGADLRESNVETARSLANANFDGVTGLTSEQKKHCLAKGAVGLGGS